MKPIALGPIELGSTSLVTQAPMGGSNCSFSFNLHRSVPHLCTLFSTTKPDTGEPTLHLSKQFC